MIDGVDDQGFGDAVIYSRVGGKKGGAVESTMLETFLLRLNHASHAQRWYILGRGEQVVRFIRAKNILASNNKVPVRLRRTEGDIRALRQRARSYCDEEREVTYTYVLRDFGKRYNGGGFRGTGGPKTEWLRHAVQAWIAKHYPELQGTLLTEFFKTKVGWILMFTVPYWASSQPIEQVWAYIKNYVALRWFPGRTTAQLRAQVLAGMYSLARVGVLSKNMQWKEPRGLKASAGLTPEIACKFIQHSIAAVNKHISESRYIKHMGPVGSWSQEDIDRLVLPTASDMIGDEIDELDDIVAQDVIASTCTCTRSDDLSTG